MDPLDFQAPISPFSSSYYIVISISPSKVPTGQKLFDLAASLYAWFGSIDSKPREHLPIYEELSTIMLLAKCNMNGGNYMTVFEEHQGFSTMEQLCQDLYLGNKTSKEIPDVLGIVIQGLTENNYKAKLVSLIIQLDYRLRIHPVYEKGEEVQKILKELFEELLLTINPSLNENNAQAVAQQLTMILSHLDKDKEISDEDLNAVIYSLNESMNHWLKAS
jgi:hypothetical protein